MRRRLRSTKSVDKDAISVLSVLLDEALQQGGNVDANRFRADHYDKINTIEWLESQGYIRRVDNRYVPTAMAITSLESATARRVLASAERIYGRAREHYKASQAQMVRVADLAREADVPPDEARTALSFMLDVNLWCGGWTTNLSDADASIAPAEGVLKYPTFVAVVEQVREWQARSEAMKPTEVLGGTPEDLAAATSIRHGISRPDWMQSLPEPRRSVMDEVYRGVELDLRAISAMGIRAVIDMVLVELVGDVGGFDTKLNRMVAEGLMTEGVRSHMLAAIEAGNAAAHRGHVPDRTDVLALLEICQKMLHEHHVMPSQARRLRSNTPARTKA